MMNGDTILVAIIDGELAGYVQLGDVKVDVPGVRPRPGDQAVMVARSCSSGFVP
jgi:hypothetical protein